MSFSDQQLRRLKGKLEAKRVKTREHQGRELSYVEGWYVMAEANRIFGFEGWDRLSQTHQLLYERVQVAGTEVAYMARIRIIVRAGAMPVVREGTGFGSACAAEMAEAHELAIKAAETDATKRALATFGNRFGLSLHDKSKPAGRSPGPAGPQRNVAAHAAAPEPPADHQPRGSSDTTAEAASMQSALVFLKALRERLRRAASLPELDEILERTETERERLRDTHPDLRDRHGTHLVDVSRSIAALRRDELERGIRRAAQGAKVPALRPPVDKSSLTLATTKRLRNKDHLKRVAGEPCLVCGRKPAHAHHLRFAQNRGLGLKVSDEFTVPLCAIDHDQLHRSGDERKWWQERGINPLPVAEQLWRMSMAGPLRPEQDVDPAAGPAPA